MTRCVLFASLAVFALAGCAGGGATTGPPAPDFGCPSKTITDTQAALVSPAPGATGVSPTIGSVTLAYGDTGPLYQGVFFAPSDGSDGFVAGPGSNVQLPPSGQVTFTIPALRSGTTYIVSKTTFNFAHAICYTTVVANYGSFTTR